MDDRSVPATPSSTGSRAFGRRTVIAGAAWSVPVIAVASAAPAYAMSLGATWDVDEIDGYRAAQNSDVKTTTTDGRMFYAKVRPRLTNAFVTSIPGSILVTFPAGGGGVGYEPNRSSLPTGWALSTATTAAGVDILAAATDETATNGANWTFTGPITSATPQIVLVFGNNESNSGTSGAVVAADVNTPGVSMVVSTSSDDIADNRDTATVSQSGTGTNAILAGPAVFS